LEACLFLASRPLKWKPASSQESNSTHSGPDALVVTNTPIGNIGLTVCYDLRFPELFTALRRAGVQ
jgi:predicted amidohydrolase